jgi:hypothetical protein
MKGAVFEKLTVAVHNLLKTQFHCPIHYSLGTDNRLDGDESLS